MRGSLLVQIYDEWSLAACLYEFQVLIGQQFLRYLKKIYEIFFKKQYTSTDILQL